MTKNVKNYFSVPFLFANNGHKMFTDADFGNISNSALKYSYAQFFKSLNVHAAVTSIC